MQLLSLSHNGRVEISDGSHVQFIFDNINLPDSTSDEPNSHGFIAFKIKPIDNIVVGDIISGVADIYFDFNPPIITNTATTEYVDNLSIMGVNTPTISFYPNPTNGILNIHSNSIIDNIEVFDILGKKCFAKESANNTIKVDLSALQPGVYFVKVSSENSVETKKLIKN
jgi:hypothetical protein